MHNVIIIIIFKYREYTSVLKLLQMPIVFFKQNNFTIYIGSLYNEIQHKILLSIQSHPLI